VIGVAPVFLMYAVRVEFDPAGTNPQLMVFNGMVHALSVYMSKLAEGAVVGDVFNGLLLGRGDAVGEFVGVGAALFEVLLLGGFIDVGLLAFFEVVTTMPLLDESS
jgi:hypothetical protein